MAQRFNNFVDMSRSTWVSNLFGFLFSAAKSSLFPFLTLYFRHIGFSAIQTGIIMGSKTIVSMLLAPAWSRCAGKRSKRRCFLITSLILLSAVYLSLTLLPIIHMSTEQTDAQCSSSKPGKVNVSQVSTDTDTTGKYIINITSTGLPASSPLITSTNPTMMTKPAMTTNPGMVTKPAMTDRITASDTQAPLVTEIISNITDAANDTDARIAAAISQVNATFNEILDSNVMDISSVSANTSQPAIEIPTNIINLINMSLASQGLKADDLSKMTVEHIIDLAKKLPGGDIIYNQFLSKLNRKEIRLFVNVLVKQINNGPKRRQVRDLKRTWKEFKVHLSDLAISVKEDIMTLSKKLFFIILVILVIGEIFCSPPEKIADDAWFDFLDENDGLERYGKQRIWSAFAYIVFPILASFIVDATPCFLSTNIYHMHVHFYLFGGFLGLSIIVAFFYPVPSDKKNAYSSRVGKSLRLICCNASNLTYMISLLVMGLSYSTFNYLFWVVEDLGGRELPMGIAVAVSAFSELPMMLVSESLVKKLSSAGVMALAMACMAGRLLYLSFLWSPWAVIPIELLHALSHTAMWWAVLSNPDFAVSTSIDRSIRSVLSSIYFGIGFGCGSLISGFVYDIFGAPILYQSTSVMVVVWCLLFCVIQKCLPKKKKLRYKKLLQAEEDDGSDTSNTYEDDWLEHALKDK